MSKLFKNRTLVVCTLSNINKMAYFYAACVVCVTIFSSGEKFRVALLQQAAGATACTT